MTTHNPLDAAELILAIDQDRRLAKEVLGKLPDVVRGDENTDVTFHIEPDVTIPSLKKLSKITIDQNLASLNGRLAQSEQALINVIGETARLGQSLGLNKLNPSWSAMDLMVSNTDGDITSPLYNASVDGGLRFAAEANIERTPRAKITQDVAVKNNWLTAKYTEINENQTNGSYNYFSSLYNYLMKNMTLTEVQKQRLTTRSYTTTETRTEKYGGYYQWQTKSIFNRDSNNREIHQQRIYVEGGTREVTFNKTHYYSALETYIDRVTSYSLPQTQGLNGDFAVIAQTFYLPKTRVLVSTEYYEYRPQSGGIERKFMLCRCKYGQPLLNDVIAEGEAVINGNSDREKIRINWDKPILVNANEQLAIVILFKSDSFKPYYSTTDNNRTGQLLTTKDYFYWEKLLYQISGNSTSSTGAQDITANGVYGIAFNQSMDLEFALIFAQFSGEQEILMPNFDLAGGISTAKVQYVSQMPADNSATIATMVKINNQWQPLSVLNQSINLPPSTEAKLILRGTQDVMPIVDVERTVYTLFRPKNQLTYVTKPRQRPTNNIVKLAIEVAGYDSRYHTINCVILAGEGQQEVQATVAVSGTSSDSSTGTKRYEFSLPPEAGNYRIKVTGSTVNASVGFDISSIVEFH